MEFNKDSCKVLHLGIKCTSINGPGGMLARKDPGIAVDHHLRLSGVVCMALRFHQGSIGDETCQINSGGGIYSSVLSTVCLASVLGFLFKKDVVDKAVSRAPTRPGHKVCKNQLLSFFSLENRKIGECLNLHGCEKMV